MTEQRQKTAETVVEKLIEKGWTISFAESCTGGMACARLVDVANASKVLNASFVTYANEAKQGLLGVSAETLNTFGAVSEETAKEMAQGVARANKAQVGVGISGIAGPGGGTEEKPVGTVCFGFSIDGKTFTERKQFGDLGRQTVRQCAVDFVFETLEKQI
jgi:nicotinamide-nucleotide amidase